MSPVAPLRPLASRARTRGSTMPLHSSSCSRALESTPRRSTRCADGSLPVMTTRQIRSALSEAPTSRGAQRNTTSTFTSRFRSRRGYAAQTPSTRSPARRRRHLSGRSGTPGRHASTKASATVPRRLTARRGERSSSWATMPPQAPLPPCPPLNGASAPRARSHTCTAPSTPSSRPQRPAASRVDTRHTRRPLARRKPCGAKAATVQCSHSSDPLPTKLRRPTS
mmetsp:Transcript_10698/g.35210  ORF Transcript_10698/g.35210 Transcript_10698/m.35210 type:complete len:224 (-) Transcript_10698:290-961(-)